MDAALGRKHGKVVLTDQHVPCGFAPAFDERGLQLVDDWTFNLGVRITPMIIGSAVAGPCLADAVPSRKTEFSVDHQNAPVIAIIVAQELPGGDELKYLDASEPLQPAAGLEPQLGYILGDFAAAVRINQ